MAESTDGRHLLLGEVKWSDQADAADVLAGLVRKAQRIPFRRRRRLHYALWLKRRVGDRVDGAPVIGPDTVMAMTPEPPKDAAPKDAAPSSGRIR